MSQEIVIEEYNPHWSEIYELEKAKLLEALRDKISGIEHIGSTAVPGLPAKPIVDILLLVERLEAPEIYSASVEKLGYKPFTILSNDLPEHLFSMNDPRTAHLHLVRLNGPEHRRHIAFRDYLRAHPEVTAEYARLKKELARHYQYDREAYTHCKTDFVRKIETLALGE